MFEMFLNSVTLFFRGKLFKEKGKVYRQVLLGAVLTAAICVALVLAGAPTVVSLCVGAMIGGAVQPWLFKDLKYA
ncbi:MAG: hypothetical protein AAGH76_17365 [Pseudomonadota bacterium]